MSSLIVEKIAQHKRGYPVGFPSICSAHPLVLEAAARLSTSYGAPLLIESTCNQVNQDGGYTGFFPENFATYVKEIASRYKLPPERLILGGDHLGPYPWRCYPAEKAMEKARQLVEAYVLAGYTKIHLDASMPCADDPADQQLPIEVTAQRTAELCIAAENALTRLGNSNSGLVYVIGSEVPAPGGVQSEHESMSVSRVESLKPMVEQSREAFLRLGLEQAWVKVVALVVQPGIEFTEKVVFPYQRSLAVQLSRFIEQFDRLVYEAHSTDYQTPAALKQLVEDHFAILKVGPALTYAFREAVFDLAHMEKEYLDGRDGIRLSYLMETLEQVMLAEPFAWESYYQGDIIELRQARKFSYSDRSRYYWTDAQVQSALAQLFENLEANLVPETLLSQYMPIQYSRFREGILERKPADLVIDYISEAILPYIIACGSDYSTLV